MSVIAEIIDTLENKVEKLILKIKRLDQNNQELKIELTKSAYIIKTQSTDIEALKSKYETLKIATLTRQ
jgi:predicted  nucleic acid-binding Zn-ribbon protein